MSGGICDSDQSDVESIADEFMHDTEEEMLALPIGSSIATNYQQDCPYVLFPPEPKHDDEHAHTSNRKGDSTVFNKTLRREMEFERLETNYTSTWCKCLECDIKTLTMPREAMCCQEVKFIQNELKNSATKCITFDRVFQTRCLEFDGLENAYLAYQDALGDTVGPFSLNPNNPEDIKKLRFTAYKNFCRWMYGKLGKRVRLELPCCVVSKIRSKYPDPDGSYIGFKNV